MGLEKQIDIVGSAPEAKVSLRYNYDVVGPYKADAEMLRDLKIGGLLNSTQGRRRREVESLRELLGLTVA